MTMPGRTYTATSGYRYGFNGKENDKDAGEGIQDYGERIYDSRLGRFLSFDPIASKYPELSPYQFASNSPILFIDYDGAEGKWARIFTYTNLQLQYFANEYLKYQFVLKQVTDKEIKVKIISQMSNLQSAFNRTLIFQYKHLDDLKRETKAEKFIGTINVMGAIGIFIAGSSLTIYSASASATTIVAGFEEGGLVGGISAIGIEALEFLIADATGIPIPLKSSYFKAGSSSYYASAIKELTGNFKTWTNGKYQVKKMISSLKSSIKNLQKKKDLHIDFLNNPYSDEMKKKGINWDKLTDKEQKGLIEKWSGEIKLFDAKIKTNQEALSVLETIKSSTKK